MKQGHHLVMTEPGQIFWQIFWLDRTWRCQHPVCRIEQQNFRRRGRVPVPRASLEVLVRRKRSACSSAVENFKSPQHHDGGRYQRGHRQHTLQGSDSHPYSPLPSPTPGLVDSLNRGQSAGRDRHSFVGKLWFPGHTWFYGGEKAPMRGLLASVVPEQCDQQNDRQRYAQQPQQCAFGEIHVVLFHG